MRCMTYRLFVLALAILWPLAAQAEIVGPARVIDGDRLEIRGQRIRLAGIDAPELGQDCLRDGGPWPCGQDAKRALARRIGLQAVNCVPTEKERDGWILAACSVAGKDLGEWMLLNGWAVASHLYSYEYSRAEAMAKSERRGIWGSRFELPWQWRKRLEP